MNRVACSVLLAAWAAVAAPSAWALSASEVFNQVSPSVWKVRTYDKEGLPLGTGSAVVIAPERAVTNCHVLAKAGRVALTQGPSSLAATLELWDTARDLCQLKVPGLTAAPVALGDSSALSIGQAAYTVGNPKGLELTLGSGLVSSLRRNDAQELVLIQTSAPISAGSSGGGLFDDQARLIGITTMVVAGEAQNLNFAVPVAWVQDLATRHARLHGAERTASTAPAPAPAPAAPPAPRQEPPARRPAPPVSPPAVAAAPPAPSLAPAPAAAAVPQAEVDDVSRLPHSSAKMIERYRVFLDKAPPRAFAISETGGWWMAWGKTKDPNGPQDVSERALRGCEENTGRRCFLYAVDGQVVYRPQTGTSPP